MVAMEEREEQSSVELWEMFGRSDIWRVCGESSESRVSQAEVGNVRGGRGSGLWWSFR